MPGGRWTSAFRRSASSCGMRFVVPVVTPAAGSGGAGNRQEPQPGRSGCRRGPRTASRSGPHGRLPVPARSGLRPQPAGRARSEHRGSGARSSPSARAARPCARIPRAAPGRGRTLARDHLAGRTPGRRPGRAGHGRSRGCGPGPPGRSTIRPHRTTTPPCSITLSDTEGPKRTHAVPPFGTPPTMIAQRVADMQNRRSGVGTVGFLSAAFLLRTMPRFSRWEAKRRLRRLSSACRALSPCVASDEVALIVARNRLAGRISACQRAPG